MKNYIARLLIVIMTLIPVEAFGQLNSRQSAFREILLIAYAQSHSIARSFVSASKICPTLAPGADGQRRSQDILDQLAFSKLEYENILSRIEQLLQFLADNEESRDLLRQLAGSFRGTVVTQKQAAVACETNPHSLKVATLVLKMDFAPLVKDAEKLLAGITASN